jgi:sulfoxide reductase heme-binding subunit YedZ
MTQPDPLNYGWWLASRSAGIVAIVLVTVAVIAGLLLGGRMTRRPGMAKVVKTVHEQAALTGLVAIAVHALTLVADPWLKPGVVGVLVPFTMDYRPVWTGLGVVAGELAALLGLSFYLRSRIGPKRWRMAHRLTPVAYVASVAHVLGAGTDAGAAWLRVPLLASAGLVAALLVTRLRGQRRRPAPRGAQPAQPSGI